MLISNVCKEKESWFAGRLKEKGNWIGLNSLFPIVILERFVRWFVLRVSECSRGECCGPIPRMMSREQSYYSWYWIDKCMVDQGPATMHGIPCGLCVMAGYLISCSAEKLHKTYKYERVFESATHPH